MNQIHHNQINTLQKRSHRSVWVAGIMTILFAPAGYIYTLRYKTAFIAIILYTILIGIAGESKKAEDLLGFLVIGATIENVISIKSAKSKLKEIESNDNGNIHLNPSPLNSVNNVEIIVLKVLQKGGIMTVSEIIVATELSPQIIKKTLQDLETEQLVYAYNRDSDGAVVYKNI